MLFNERNKRKINKWKEEVKSKETEKSSKARRGYIYSVKYQPIHQ